MAHDRKYGDGAPAARHSVRGAIEHVIDKLRGRAPATSTKGAGTEATARNSEPSEPPDIDLGVEDRIHSAGEAVSGDGRPRSWGYGLGNGGDDGGLPAVMERAEMIRGLARARGHHPAGAALPPVEAPPIPAAKPDSDEFDFDRYPHTHAARKDDSSS